MAGTSDPADVRGEIRAFLSTRRAKISPAQAGLPVYRGDHRRVSGLRREEVAVLAGAYAASKFGVEGWIESLTPEVAPFGIRTMLVEPGFFRTELLTPESTNYAGSSIEDYAERAKQTVAAWNAMNGQQSGDPTKLADALVQLASQDEPPLRFAAGADAVGAFEQKAKDLLAEADAYRELSDNLACDDA